MTSGFSTPGMTAPRLEGRTEMGYVESFDLTRGQWLSVALFAAGLALLIVAGRQKTEPLGGWRGRPAQTGVA
jgi:hypothetical protein